MSRSRLLHLLLAVLVLAASLLIPAATPVPASSGDFVTVQGTQLIFRGKPIKLKGVNFYPKDQPWANMWERWKGESTRNDLLNARELDINSIRVMVPYKPENGWTDKETGAVVPEYLNQLRQMVQMAGEFDIKVIITLFDFYDMSFDRPVAGSAAEARNKRYLKDIVAAFRDDDRVLAWDIHNEPDHYETWKDDRDPTQFIDWISRMADEIRRLDPNHLVTVGMGQFDNLFVADASGAPELGKKANGRTVADISDFLSFHSYNAGNMDWQVAYIRDHSNKPLVLQETGWPSGPPCVKADFSESQQTFLYGEMIKAANKWDLSGLMQWMLWDLKPGASLGKGRETHEDYFGLLKRDGTWKPAMPLFRDAWPVEPLPSVTRSNLPLTNNSQPVPPPNPNAQPPLYFPETGHYIYDAFRDYWRRFGGLTVFGYPLTEQREEGGYWVQYFERARFELHEEALQTPGYLDLEKSERYKLLVKLSLLGVDLAKNKTGGKGFARVDAPPQSVSGFAYFPETGHTLLGKIGEYWHSHTGITNFGYPISEAAPEVSQADGKTYLVQYFQRTRLEYHPEHAGTPYEVQLGLLGRELLASKGCK